MKGRSGHATLGRTTNGSPASRSRKLGRGGSPKPSRHNAQLRATEGYGQPLAARTRAAPLARRPRSEPLPHDGSAPDDPDSMALPLPPPQQTPTTRSWAQMLGQAIAETPSPARPPPEQPQPANLSYADVARISNAKTPHLLRPPPPWPLATQPGKANGAAAGERAPAPAPAQAQAPAATSRPAARKDLFDRNKTRTDNSGPRNTRAIFLRQNELADGGAPLVQDDTPAEDERETSMGAMSPPLSEATALAVPTPTLKFMFSDSGSDHTGAKTPDEQDEPNAATSDDIRQTTPVFQYNPHADYLFSTSAQTQAQDGGSSINSRGPPIRSRVVQSAELSSVLGRPTIFAGGMTPSADTYMAPWPGSREFREQTNNKLPRPRWSLVGYNMDGYESEQIEVEHRGSEIIPDRWHWNPVPSYSSRQVAFEIKLEETHGPLQSLLEFIDQDGEEADL